MRDALNGQINEELFSSYLYLQMSAWFESINLKGFARWMAVQSAEETAHAMRLYRHVLDRGGKVALRAVAEPPAEWESPLAAFQAAYEHERHITGCFDKLTDLAAKETDHAAAIFLQWYVVEQVEEEASAGEIVAKLEMVKDAPGGLLMLDRELGGRQSD
jgi:ferritin